MRRTLILAGALLTVAGGPALAQAPAGGGFKAEFKGTYDQVERKLAQLAEAMPLAKYDWRPAAGVRSVCEVFMHVSYDNYVLGAPFGVKMPPEFSGAEPEKCPGDKAKVLAAMKTSFAAFNAAIAALSDSDLAQNATMFGSTMSKRAWMLATAEHAGEHLGQSIAYARMNGVVPPWSK